MLKSEKTASIAAVFGPQKLRILTKSTFLSFLIFKLKLKGFLLQMLASDFINLRHLSLVM